MTSYMNVTRAKLSKIPENIIYERTLPSNTYFTVSSGFRNIIPVLGVENRAAGAKKYINNAKNTISI